MLPDGRRQSAPRWRRSLLALAGIFSAKQFTYGVRSRIWGKSQGLRSAFVVKRFGGGVFKRTDKARAPVEQLWGPSVPKEMLRDEAYVAWTCQNPRILTEASRLMALMLSGAGLPGRQRGLRPP